MRKKVFIFASVVAAVTLMVTVLAAFAYRPAKIVAAMPTKQAPQVSQTALAAPNGAPSGGCDLFSIMFNDDGLPVSREQLEVNTNAAIEDGYLAAGDKELIIEMYDFCVSGRGNAGFQSGSMGGCP